MKESKPSQTIEDYLSLIYVLERDGEPVVGARIAELKGVTPPTVTNTLKRMTRDGLITMGTKGTHLTEEGWKVARAVMRRHMLMEWMMVRLLPWSKLHSEAHGLEHAISPDAESALYVELGQPQTCPHGNPLPGFEEVVSAWAPLAEVPVGQAAIVRRVHELAEENSQILEFLESKRLIIGAIAMVLENLPFNQTLTLQVEGQPVTLGYAVARYIFVEEVIPPNQAHRLD
jgi:DtxR family Mn-dependent transcriptional regulator